MSKNVILLVLLQWLTFIDSQRVAPGVPPQHYQPPSHQPQYQQQHVPVQHHQVPVQPQYQQHQQHPPQEHVPHQQHIPQQHQQPQHQQPQQHHQPQQPQQPQAHDHHQSGHHNPQLLNPGNIQHEKEHIQEHLDVPIDTSKMSEQELQFHYFKMHDADNNNKLDGCELIKSLIHWHGNENTESVSQTDEVLATLGDQALKEMDKNDDGFISYEEFRLYTEPSS